jgi:ApbE superfamily uncharacterized protein (UPF0280 family)
MSGAVVRRLDDGRWHFQHGPIDCIVGAEGDAAAIASAVERAGARFGAILDELVAELPLLRTDLGSSAGAAVQPSGPIARRMVAACRRHASGGRFITAMAAVAGSVAEELIAFFEGPGIVRAYVNNGGDIALHLAPGAAFEIGWIADTDAALLDQAAGRLPGPYRRGPGGLALDGTFRVTADSGVRGVATSGWRGRSFSLGVADSATVLAATAAQADAAATVIANAVDADDPHIRRAPANRLRDDSDLGERLVTCAVGALQPAVVAGALAAGAAVADAEIRAGRAVATALCLQGQVRTCGDADAHSASTPFDTLGPEARGRDPLRFGVPRPIAVSPSPRT